MIVSSRSLGIVMIVSTQSRSASRPRSACSCRFLPFELERLGDDGDRQRAELAREARNHGRRPGPRAAAESGRHENHVGAVERLHDRFGVLERGLTADVRIGAGAEPLGQLVANLQLEGAGLTRSACRSVLATMNSTPSRPPCTMRLTALLPPPPTPMTLMRAPVCASSSRRSRSGPWRRCVPIVVISHSWSPCVREDQKNSLNKPRSRPATCTSAPAPTGARGVSNALR